MHTIEPFFQWNELYNSAEDEMSLFYGRTYNEFQYTNKVYNYYIHPQWDEIGSETLYIKILFADYDEGMMIIELIGEWNDCINNDIMYLKRDIVDHFIEKGIRRFILLCEHIFNFHGSDDCYYEEWKEDIAEDGGFIAMINPLPHVLEEMKRTQLGYHVIFNKKLMDLNWRKMNPMALSEHVQSII